MIHDEELDAAVDAGVIDHANAVALREWLAERRGAAGEPTGPDEEQFRLVSSFNDIFVVIAASLLLMALSSIGEAQSAWLGSALAAIGAWLLAEFFVRRRHMALPAIMLLAVFVGGVFGTGYRVVEIAGGQFAANMLTGSAAAVFGALLHWYRFKVPLTIAAGVGAAVSTGFALLLYFFPDFSALATTYIFASGVGVFVLGFKWDASDTARQTRRSDVAFWLHVLAAPLLVHPVFSALGATADSITLAKAAAIFAVYLVIGLVSLAIDRRALMVSALGYVLYAFTNLLDGSGSVSLSFAATALAVGSGLLLLSAFWHGCRRFALLLLPEPLAARVPAPQTP